MAFPTAVNSQITDDVNQADVKVPGDAPALAKSAQDFARALTLIVDASAHSLTALSRVLEQQQRSILALASEAGVSAPNTAGTTSAPGDATAQAASPAPSANTAPAASPAEAASPALPSAEAPLALSETSARAAIAHVPEAAIAQLCHASMHAVSLALMNTVTAQQHLNLIAQAVVTRGAANQLSASRLLAAPPTEKATGAR